MLCRGGVEDGDQSSPRHNTGDAIVFQYADDTQVMLSGPAGDLRVLISRMEDSLASLNDWFSANALKVNASKTQLIVFGSRQKLTQIARFQCNVP